MTRVCLKCECPTVRALPALTASDKVTFFRCTTCGHVWHVSKYVSGAPPTTVMEGRVVEKCKQA